MGRFNRRKAVAGSSGVRSTAADAQSSWRSEIEGINSPRTRRVNDNAANVFSAFVFVVAFLIAAGISFAALSEMNIWVLCIGFAAAILAIFTVRIAAQWERVIILRFGTFSRVAGPGPYLTIPFIDHVALRADQRTMLTGFGAEEALTADLVPVNVDAAVFWMVWDAEKACMEVENYYDAVSMAAQTALRDAIGRKSISDLTAHRDQLDQELRDAIEEKTSPWGVSIMSVEIRDLVIPKDLQEAMSAEARAEREKDARIVLAEVEQDIAAMLHDAADVYREDELALRLRQMHLVNQTLRDSKGSVVVPSAYADGFAGDATGRPGEASR